MSESPFRPRRGPGRDDDFDFTYLSLGAGIQSSALLILCCTDDAFPRPDVAIFADTQNEPTHVYEQFGRMRDWAEPYGVPVEEVSAGDLLQDAVDKMEGRRKRYSSIPMWVQGAEGRPVPARRHCTRDYKINPIKRRVRELLGYQPRQRIKERVRCLLGISTDEILRSKPSRTRWITNAFPLVDADLDRRACVEVVQRAGLPEPRKSACVFCPYTSDQRWLRMQEEDPEGFEAACRADEALRDQSAAGLDSEAFVHRSLQPLREVDFRSLIRKTQGFSLFGEFTEECEGMCGL